MLIKNLEKYLKGSGLDVSEVPEYSLLIPHFYQVPSNLYRPSQFFSSGSLDFVYSKDVATTKFYKILLKEWFDLIRKGGYLVLCTQPKDLLSCEELSPLIKDLFGNTAVILSQGKEGSVEFLVIKKLSRSKRLLGNINSWTFGIITGGSRPENVASFVESVRRQKVPNYEVIISGKWKESFGKDTRVVNQTRAANKGHITKMKNVLCKEAKYENIILVHDRVVLKDTWFEGMKLYGNSFELLACPQLDYQGNRAGDWLTLGGPIDTPYNAGALEYDDWDENVYVSGTITVLKRSVWKEKPWDEKVFWNKGEDIKLTFDLRDKGYIARFNPYSEAIVTNWRHGSFPLHERNLYKLGRKKKMLFRRFLWFFLRVTNNNSYVVAAREFVFKKFVERSALRRFIVTH